MGRFIKWFIFIDYQCCCYLNVLWSMDIYYQWFWICFCGKTVRFHYVLGWCLCKDKPHGTIILTTISFCAYNDNYKLWIFLSFYIWTPTKLSYKHRSMFWTFGCFDIVTIIFFHEFLCYIKYDWVHVTLVILLYYFYSLSLTIQLENN